ncbi:hypothetical protein TUST1-182_00085 [Vibrio phage ICP1_2006_C]|nr:hypothetical protein TUST1-191_00085 [Vibrio phage ICP1_2006_D]ADX88290.1 hypothetical protein TUST1-182_00085 [Vibrio phage ICP1_2006_C]ADX88517.1 hypothetical protein TUST1-159_00085 [Vibrio phage ICP1_2006_B]ADX88743.1 hypothetical protein TUST1-17_00085 [Vibrio phage ICP1_2006_A]ADX89201.1 hypothetical protein TUST1-2_00095 [Vibrio phage ICP1_2001_A]WOZ53655.1 hypothetical protein [Vibrio phage VRU]
MQHKIRWLILNTSEQDSSTTKESEIMRFLNIPVALRIEIEDDTTDDQIKAIVDQLPENDFPLVELGSTLSLSEEVCSFYDQGLGGNIKGVDVWRYNSSFNIEEF